MKRKLKYLKTFEDVQSYAVSALYDTGAAGAFGRFKNENPALELEEEIDRSEDRNIFKYEMFIRKLFRNLKKIFFLDDTINVKDIKIMGSYGTSKWKRGKSDIDFAVETVEPLPSYLDFISVIDYLNSELLKEFGEVEGKGGFVEVLKINDTTIFQALGGE